jgi:hypothetical protein
MMYDFDHGLAMAYGDEFNPNKIYTFELRAFCEETGETDLLLADELLFVRKLEEQMAVRLKDVERCLQSRTKSDNRLNSM